MKYLFIVGKRRPKVSRKSIKLFLNQIVRHAVKNARGSVRQLNLLLRFQVAEPYIAVTNIRNKVTVRADLGVDASAGGARFERSQSDMTFLEARA